MSRSAAGLSLVLLASGCATVGAPAPVAPSDAAAEPAPAEPAFLAADIKGRRVAELDALLGVPDLARVEGEGEFRRYMLRECALLIILYPDEGGVKRAASVEAGALKVGGEKPDLDRCLAFGRAEPA